MSMLCALGMTGSEATDDIPAEGNIYIFLIGLAPYIHA